MSANGGRWWWLAAASSQPAVRAQENPFSARSRTHAYCFINTLATEQTRQSSLCVCACADTLAKSPGHFLFFGCACVSVVVFDVINAQNAQKCESNGTALTSLSPVRAGDDRRRRLAVAALTLKVSRAQRARYRLPAAARHASLSAVHRAVPFPHPLSAGSGTIFFGESEFGCRSFEQFALIAIGIGTGGASAGPAWPGGLRLKSHARSPPPPTPTNFPEMFDVATNSKLASALRT